MPMEKENLSEEDVLKGADDAAARIRAKRAARAAGAKEEKMEEKVEQSAVSLGFPDLGGGEKVEIKFPELLFAPREKPKDKIEESAELSKSKEEVGIENEILEGEAKPAPVPGKSEIKASSLTSLKKELKELKEEERVRQEILDYFGVKIGDRVKIKFEEEDVEEFGCKEDFGEIVDAKKIKHEGGEEIEILETDFKKSGTLFLVKNEDSKRILEKILKEEASKMDVLGAEAGGEVFLKQEPELEQAVDAGGKKKELTEEERQKEVEKLEEIESGWEGLRKKIDVVRQEIKRQTAEKSLVLPKEKTLEERRAEFEINKQKVNLIIKNVSNISEQEKRRMEKIIEELEKRLKVK